jgi:hypothetical protein
MFNLNNSGFSSDSNSPVKYVDTAYDALKYNVPATQQLLQAAQQGQPVGLAGLGAMAAQKYQDQATMAQQQQNAMQQGPTPTVLAQITSGGIMSQLQPNAALNQAPEGPPQQMAAGGIVALNDGGFVDYSYDGGEGYAGGGYLRGYASGEEIALDEEIEREIEEENAAALERAMRGAPPKYPKGETATPRYPDMELPITADVKGPAVTYADIPVPSDKERKPKEHGFFEMPEGKDFNLSDPTPSSAYWQRPGADRGRAEISQGLDALLNPIGEKIDEAKARWGDRYDRAKKEWDENKADLKRAKEAITSGKEETDREKLLPFWFLNDADMPEDWNAKHGYGMSSADAAEPSNAKETPKAEVNKAGTKTDKSFENQPQTAVHKKQDAQPKRLASTRGTTPPAATPAFEKLPAEEARASEMQRIRQDMAQEQATEAPASLPPSEQGVASLPTEWDNKPTSGDYQSQIETLQKLYQGNRTGRLSPETASRLAAMEDQATRDKWLGALTAFGGGMFGAETPYMSQAIASGALKGLSAYQQGSQNEEQAAIRALQAQMSAEKEPEEARQKALNTYMQAQLASGKSAADIRKAMITQQALAGRDVYKAGEAMKRAELYAQNKPGPELTEMSKVAQIQAIADTNAQKEMDDLDKAASQAIPPQPPLTSAQRDSIRQKWYREYNIPTFAGTGAFNSGLGAGSGMGGRPMRMDTSGQLIR